MPNKPFAARALVALALLLLSVAGRARAAVVSSTTFTADPTPAGWTALGGATWNGANAIAVNNGNWLGPSFSVTPGDYYKFQYTAAAASKGYATVFGTNPAAAFDREPASGSNGANPLFYRTGQLLSDNYGTLPAAASPAPALAFFRAPTQATQAFVMFTGGGATIRDATVSTATRADVATWADGLLAGPLKNVRPAFAAPANRPAALPRTFNKLTTGGQLKVAMLGDSIVADMMNSTFDVLVERAYPGSSVKILEATGHGAGMAAWNAPDATWQQAGLKLNPATVDTAPDLLIVGGISNGGAGNLAATATIIDRVRNGVQAANGYRPDVLLVTGAAYDTTPAAQAAYRDSLAQLASSKGVAFLDYYGAWSGYVSALQAQGVTLDQLQRDSVHNSDLAKQVLGRTLETYFVGVPEPTALAPLLATLSLIARPRRRRRPPPAP